MLWSQYKLATIRCTEFLRKEITGIPNSKYRKSEFQFFDSPDIGISKKTDRNLWNWKRYRNSAYHGGPRNRNQKWNSQPRAWRDYWTYQYLQSSAISLNHSTCPCEKTILSMDCIEVFTFYLWSFFLHFTFEWVEGGVFLGPISVCSSMAEQVLPWRGRVSCLWK
jgi:hypothetical protein